MRTPTWLESSSWSSHRRLLRRFLLDVVEDLALYYVKDCEAVVLLYGTHVLFIGEQRRNGLQLNNQPNPILTRAKY
jgi:hypothetical protein